MLCHDFFLAAIDPGYAREPETDQGLVEHRQHCEECRELEKDYPTLMKLVERDPVDLPPAPPEFEEELMLLARETVAGWRREKIRRFVPRAVLVAAGLSALLLAGAVVSGAFATRPRLRLPAVNEPCVSVDERAVRRGAARRAFEERRTLEAGHLAEDVGEDPEAIEEQRRMARDVLSTPGKH